MVAILTQGTYDRVSLSKSTATLVIGKEYLGDGLHCSCLLKHVFVLLFKIMQC